MGNTQSEIKYLKKEIKCLKKENKRQQKEIMEIKNTSQEIYQQTDFNDKLFFSNADYQNLNLRSLTTIASSNSNTPQMEKGRKITHINKTSSKLDLYLTIGGAKPQGIKLIAILEPTGKPGDTHIFDILDYDTSGSPIGYNLSYNFNVLEAGKPIPKYNAGPTLAEFGTNQIWAGFVPDLRDTFDISCVPAGIGNLLCNDGQVCRDNAVKLSVKAGYTQQQAYNYNVGCKIIPPTDTAISSGNLQTVSLTDPKAPYSSQAIGYPLDTAVPKQQTSKASGTYTVEWIGPVVSLGNYKTN